MPNGNLGFYLKKKKKILEKGMKSNEELDTKRMSETSKKDTRNEKMY